ncbi:UDP-N-acetylmuramate dehydrogenase, partial [Candidatus Saccharibacteria bacterium]|nr:UDP-N-acetylmuramate dehydrogenase [Candidatus Saccharibacteria bacterium]
DCNFSYRSSIFRSTESGHYAILSVTLQFQKTPLQPPFYDSLQKRFDQNNITNFTPQIIRENVLAIRADKLPNPSTTPNAGSFFKNPIIEAWKVDDIRSNGYSDLPTYPVDETYMKIPAGWLIEQCDLKGEILHGIRIHDKNAVVLINQSATGYEDLKNAKDQIISAVSEKFQIILEQEPLELVPPTQIPTL